jgi:5-methylcytosine-specific restriction enzyme subunit McrC
MAQLFEDFIRNFYKIEAPVFRVSREDIYWGPEGTDKDSIPILPKMVTDISIEGEHSKAIIDTKYYKEALRKYFDKEKIREQNIYQIFAYLKNLEKKGGKNQNCTGVLLYPTVDKNIDERAPLDSNHDLIVRTIDLNQDWWLIHRDLITLLEKAL